MDPFQFKVTIDESAKHPLQALWFTIRCSRGVETPEILANRLFSARWRLTEQFFEKWAAFSPAPDNVWTKKDQVLQQLNQYLFFLKENSDDEKKAQEKERIAAFIDQLEQSALDEAFAATRIDLCLRLKLASDICSGMIHLHHETSPPIIHRDLKSCNVFLTHPLSECSAIERCIEDGSPIAVVGDFGLSIRLVGLSGAHAPEGSWLNRHLNPTWAAPEILAGQTYAMPSDVYAMGLLLWELLTRSHPFKKAIANNPLFMGQEKKFILKGGRPHIEEELRSQNKEYIELIEQCWQSDPSQRPSFIEIYGKLVDIAVNQKVSKLSKGMLEKYEKYESTLLSSNIPSSSSNIPSSSSNIPSSSSNIPSSLSNTSSSSSNTSSSSSNVFGTLSNAFEFFDSNILLESLPPLSKNLTHPLDESLSMRPTLLCLVFRRFIWVGFKNGHVCVFDLNQSNTPVGVYSLLNDAHRLAIRGLVFDPSFGGHIWSGSEDGLIQVWQPTPLSPIARVEMIKQSGWVLNKPDSMFRRYQRRWLVVDSGHLHFYTDQVVNAPKRTIRAEHIVSFTCIDDTRQIWRLVFKNEESNGREETRLLTTAPESVASSNDESEYRQLDLNLLQRNIGHLVTHQSATTLYPFISHQLSHGIGALAASKNDTVLCSSHELAVYEFTIDHSADRTGFRPDLHSLKVLRKVQVDPNVIRSNTKHLSFFGYKNDKLCIGGGNTLLYEAVENKFRAEWSIPSSGGQISAMSYDESSVWIGDTEGHFWENEENQPTAYFNDEPITAIAASPGVLFIGTSLGNIYRKTLVKVQKAFQCHDRPITSMLYTSEDAHTGLLVVASFDRSLSMHRVRIPSEVPKIELSSKKCTIS